VFIVNPAAGKGHALEMVSKIHSRFKGFAQSYEIKVTEAVGHASALAKEAAAACDDVRIYAVGGDGTLNEVLNGMAETSAELGIIPCGSGNDAVRSLYTNTDPVKLIETLPDSPSSLVDLGKFNDKYFINIASIGFDAEVVLKTQVFKKIPFISGSLAYILGVFSSLIELKKYKLRMVIDESPKIEKKFLLSIFANGIYYGGGMKSAPRAKTNDGILDFYLVEAMSRLKIMKFFPLFRKGEHEFLNGVTVSRGVNAYVESDQPFPINIDGEVSMETKVKIALFPSSIKVITPQA
jgi:YegS/Rv2252/BmrU family lipid kinase